MDEDYIERVWEEAKLLYLKEGEELLPTLIMLAYSDGVDAEREACAEVSKRHSKRDDDMGAIIAAAIRARSNT